MQLTPDIIPDQTWIISDTHFGHENIKGYCHRPQDVEQIMMEEWARAVQPEDTVLHLGDLCWKGNAWFKNMIAPHLTGRKYLIRGNHDKGRPSFYRNCGFTEIKPFRWKLDQGLNGALSMAGDSRKLKPYTISFSHYPWNDEDGPIPAGLIRVHGHIHNNGYADGRREGVEGRFVPYRRNQINVSAEMMKYKPVRLDNLLAGALGS